jgi:2,4-dienoyl-CoA reductase-like NADH-dependent reductase (Old Yellow Enzyme family)
VSDEDGRLVQMRTLRSAAELAAHLDALGIDFTFDDDVESAPAGPLAQPLSVLGATVGNRFAVLPMEGWDGEEDGRPSELVRRRWRRIGAGGAKLVWGEATAVRADARANPNQLVLTDETVDAFAAARAELLAEHERAHGTTNDLLVGLQLTHSGRWSRPHGEPQPRVAYHHPQLDERVPVGARSMLSDDELDALIGDFVHAAALAADAGFAFLDVKHCHGYLLHELLSAYDRPGRYGGDFHDRTRFLRSVVAGVREHAPALGLAVRLSAFDVAPYVTGADGVGCAEVDGDYRYAFGGDGTGHGIDLTEPDRFLGLCEELGVGLVSITAGSPYYDPHVQRPAYFPPSDGYLPPNDPLVDVARMLGVTAELKHRHPSLPVVASALSYLQEWLPNVAQRLVRDGGADLVGLGRMTLCYPQLPADVLAGRALERRQICRTFSDCTTAPRAGLVSGCYPLDPFYKARPERAAVAATKREAERRRGGRARGAGRRRSP